MSRARVAGYILAVALILATALFGLQVHWASRTPDLPPGWPKQSVWMAGYQPPLSIHPRGAWVSCRLDPARNVDGCQFADYKGRVFLHHDYVTCNGAQQAVPDNRLLLRNQGSVWLLRLQDGRILFQVPCPVASGGNSSSRQSGIQQ